jgi:hypothetical protein
MKLIDEDARQLYDAAAPLGYLTAGGAIDQMKVRDAILAQIHAVSAYSPAQGLTGEDVAQALFHLQDPNDYTLRFIGAMLGTSVRAPLQHVLNGEGWVVLRGKKVVTAVLPNGRRKSFPISVTFISRDPVLIARHGWDPANDRLTKTADSLKGYGMMVIGRHAELRPQLEASLGGTRQHMLNVLTFDAPKPETPAS